MSEDRGLAQAPTRDCCSLSIVFRSFRISVAFPVLVLAALGAVFTPLGWRLSEKIFVGEHLEAQLKETIARNNRLPGERPTTSTGQPEPSDIYDQTEPDGGKPMASMVAAVATNSNSFPGLTYHRFVEPFQNLFHIEKGMARFAYFLFGGLWTVLVWGLFGGAITRIAIMQLGCDERISMREGLRHSTRKITSYFMSPLLPIIGVVLCAVPIAILGVIMKADFGVIIGGIFWLLALLAGFVMTLLLLGLLFGWPLMWATLSAEGTDSFDALSRSYAYTFQRPLKYLGYVIVAILLGALTWWLVYYFSETVIGLAFWGGHWGTGTERMNEITSAVNGASAPDGMLAGGTFIMMVCVHIIRTLAMAFTYSFFWCAMCAIYLLLRRDVDQTEFDEIFVEDEEEQLGLPQVKPDEAGVPGMADKPAKQKAEDEPAGEGGEKPSAENSESSASEGDAAVESEEAENGDEEKKDGESDAG